MDLGYVKRLIKLLSSSDIDEIEIEEDGKKVRVARHRSNSVGTHQTVAVAAPEQVPGIQVSPPPAGTAVPAIPAAPAASTAPAQSYHEIKSPIVGTYYRAPAPDAAPFVTVGSHVEPGTVLCIVEAMKLMNEIESDVSGTIAKVMVENGQPVEYDQTLFLVEKT